jgi:hypothetical protein
MLLFCRTIGILYGNLGFANPAELFGEIGLSPVALDAFPAHMVTPGGSLKFFLRHRCFPFLAGSTLIAFLLWDNSLLFGRTAIFASIIRGNG